MQIRRYFVGLTMIAFLAGAGIAAYLTWEYWQPWLSGGAAAAKAASKPAAATAEAKMLKLSPQARKNLGLVSRPVELQSYWRTIQVPGVVVDRPGQSDRGVTSPAVAVVVTIHAYAGETVSPGERLFTLKLISEYLHKAQSDLYKTTQEAQLVKEQRDRLAPLAKSGAVAEIKLIELESELRRLAVAAQAHRQDLLTRGLSQSQVEHVAAGRFVSEIEVLAPPPLAQGRQLVVIKPVAFAPARIVPAYEVQDLKVELGQQVQVGQTLCLLANHQSLYIEGKGFKREAGFLEEAAEKSWPVRVEFAEDDSKHWERLNQVFHIRHLANTVDMASRAFSFFIPLSNQSRSYEKDGKTFLHWRFRPGQRVRLNVPVEELAGVIVLPASAVVREGPEAYVFCQNGDLFERKPVHVLHEDRQSMVLAKDGSIRLKLDYVAQSAAASLNRVLKAQNSGGGLPPGFHVHADGTVHGSH